jgi:hypothetical protein
VYNTVVIVVVVVVLLVVRNGCYNDFLPQVILCLFFWNMDHENESWRKCWQCTRSKPFSVGKLEILRLGIKKMWEWAKNQY